MAKIEMIEANILVVYRIEDLQGNILEDNIQAAYKAHIPEDTRNDEPIAELIVRKWIAATLIERSLAGDTRFAYDAPSVWVEILDLSVQAGEGAIQPILKKALLSPKELALAYQRPQLRAFFDKIKLNYKGEVADVKKVQH